MMRNLPKNGLIVSCYLEGMKGSERAFIATVANLSGVVALRVEGLDNIEFARRIAPDQFIIGLIKKSNGTRNLITPDLDVMGRAIKSAGADIVAAERIFHWGERNHRNRIDGINLPFRVMWDLHANDFDADIRINEDDATRVRCMAREGQIIMATTFISKAFDYIQGLRRQFSDLVLVNLEGGIENAEQLQQGFACGANYVTIGKAINDPETIIENILKGKIHGGDL